jgi:hypothetical protein
VHASGYDEIVCERLFPGNTTPQAALQPLLADAQDALQRTQEQRARTILRLDAGGGAVEEVNACLEASYQFHGKDCSTKRARRLAQSVATWYDAPAQPGRQVGQVPIAPTDYVCPVVRIALRWTNRQGQEQVCVLISTLSTVQILTVNMTKVYPIVHKVFRTPHKTYLFPLGFSPRRRGSRLCQTGVSTPRPEGFVRSS